MDKEELEKEQLIDACFDKTLTSQTSIRFKELFTNDSAFRKKVTDEYLFRKIILEAELSEMENELNQLELKVEEEVEVVPNKRKLVFVALAVVLLILISVFVFYQFQ